MKIYIALFGLIGCTLITPLSLTAYGRNFSCCIDPQRAVDGNHGSPGYFEDGQPGEHGQPGFNGQNGGNGGNGGHSVYGNGGNGGNGGDAE